MALRMFEGKRCHRGLLPVAVALVMAIAAAFGLSSTSVAADPPEKEEKDYLSNQETQLTVRDVERGVTGTAYRYAYPDWNTTNDTPSTYNYVFEDQVAKWMNQKMRGGDFKQYIVEKDNYTTETFKKLSASDMRDFSDKLLAAIANSEVVFARDEKPVESHTESDTSISFKLKMGGYLIKLSNGPNYAYQPIATYVQPKLNNGKYELKAEDVEGVTSSTVDAKSMKITSTKTVVRKDNKGNSAKAKTGTETKAHGQIGDSFIFRVTTPIPNYPDEAVNKSFTVQDQPTPGLTVTTGSITVMIDGEKEALAREKDYTTDTVEETHLNGKRGKGFQVQFKAEQYKDKLANAGKSGKKLTVEYTGTLDNKAPVKGGTKNHAHPLIPKDFYNKSDTGFASPSPTPAVTTIYTYGVKITKVGKTGRGSGASKPKLPGAEFELYRGTGNGNKVPVKEQQEAGVTATGKYVVQASTGGGTTTTITSGPNGLVQIDGLDADTYILKEIKPPAGGYTLPAKPIAIVIKDDDLDGTPDTGNGNKTSTINGKPASVDAEDNRLKHDLTNKKADFRLPKTGAIGAVIFGVVGVVLIVTSAVLVIVHRRKTKAKGAKRSS